MVYPNPLATDPVVDNEQLCSSASVMADNLNMGALPYSDPPVQTYAPGFTLNDTSSGKCTGESPYNEGTGVYPNVTICATLGNDGVHTPQAWIPAGTTTIGDVHGGGRIDPDCCFFHISYEEDVSQLRMELPFQELSMGDLDDGIPIFCPFTRPGAAASPQPRAAVSSPAQSGASPSPKPHAAQSAATQPGAAAASQPGAAEPASTEPGAAAAAPAHNRLLLRRPAPSHRFPRSGASPSPKPHAAQSAATQPGAAAASQPGAAEPASTEPGAAAAAQPTTAFSSAAQPRATASPESHASFSFSSAA
ncbi:hypothetical protein HYH03_015750 [Edaphochlamys debaryana]|uniref:Uncharacterized protein n=1 Tax=Edaphochlamys debaryana TaxID=47281 RepID=A0A835XL83_9CHLO|nr:hypothetical protein HYH03_015750 [Edaphochlamys debaryana]|eukprot:KAG2485475.1 hypothetical protein HYH03_015750 [Edaphochlamys debaryana]